MFEIYSNEIVEKSKTPTATINRAGGSAGIVSIRV